MLRELYITKACPTFLRSSGLNWLPRKLENSLPGNIMEFEASLHLQVLVPLVPLPSSTTVTTHMSSIKTLNRNLMTACLAWAWHSKSLSVGPLELRARIWLLIKLIPAWVDYVWQISLCRTWWGFKHRFGHKLGIKSKSQHTIKARSLKATLRAIILICDVFRMLLPVQDTTRKG